jgi:hypothetical protein
MGTPSFKKADLCISSIIVVFARVDKTLFQAFVKILQFGGRLTERIGIQPMF